MQIVKRGIRSKTFNSGMNIQKNISKKPTVLLVEDMEIIQKVHSEMLEKMGCQLDLASSGQQALDKFKNNYDLIIMDMGLPDMRGTDVIREIRRREKLTGSHTPIIMLTAYSEEERNICLSVGADEFALKPIQLEKLRKLTAPFLKK